MTDSLRDQLLGLGFKPAAKPERPAPARDAPRARPRGDHRADANAADTRAQPRNRNGPAAPSRATPGKQAQGQRGAGKPRSREDIDLARAYAIRAQREKDERIEAERLKQDEARLRREAKAQLATLLEGKGLNDAAADIARHFPYGGKIKRIHVTAAQLKALNAGALGVVQLDGRYLLVESEWLEQAEAIFAPAIALRVDPQASPAEDPYADPLYQVPDDLVW